VTGRAGEAVARARAPARFDAQQLATQLHAALGTLRGRALCVAYSGGLDSCVLLRALQQLRRRERFTLRALHVNHQLQAQASAWARSAAAQARRLRIDCQVLRVSVRTPRGGSLEAAAREARYAALARQLRAGELLLTAHHQEDQLETVLLALMRGSGVQGLAGMTLVTPWRGTQLLRPLLAFGRAQLAHYAREQHLQWQEDPSNLDQRFDRNYLRHTVLPLLTQRWPAAAATASRSAAHLCEARALLEQQACAALRTARDGAALRVSVLRRLQLPLRRLALRQWLMERGLGLPDQARLVEIAGPLLAARADAQPRVQWPGGELRRHADRLFAFSAAPTANAPLLQWWNWRTQPWLALADGAALGLVADRNGDVQLAALPRRLGVRFRRGGEQLASVTHRLGLKDLLQAQRLTPWERASVPLVMHGERIIAVADRWLDPAYAAGAARPAKAGSRSVPSARGRFRWRRKGGAQNYSD